MFRTVLDIGTHIALDLDAPEGKQTHQSVLSLGYIDSGVGGENDHACLPRAWNLCDVAEGRRIVTHGGRPWIKECPSPPLSRRS